MHFFFHCSLTSKRKMSCFVPVCCEQPGVRLFTPIRTYHHAFLEVLAEQGGLCFHAPVCISPLLSVQVLVRAAKWVEK